MGAAQRCGPGFRCGRAGWQWSACLSVLVPLGSLPGRTECRSRCSRRAPHEPLFRIRGLCPHGCCAPIPSPRPVRHSHTGPCCAGAPSVHRPPPPLSEHPHTCVKAIQPKSRRVTSSQVSRGPRQLTHIAQTECRRCSPSSCASNAALSGRQCPCTLLHIPLPILCAAQSAPTPPAYAPPPLAKFHCFTRSLITLEAVLSTGSQ